MKCNLRFCDRGNQIVKMWYLFQPCNEAALWKTYLDFQLLHDLHLDSTLGCAPIIQGVFTV